MKNLMKTLTALCLVLFAFSCQNDVDSIKLSNGTLKVTAKMASPATRITYGVTDELIQPGWEVGDEIFGWDDAGQTFTFTVSSVDSETGDAQLDIGTYVPATATKLYAVFYPGKDASLIIDNQISVDISTQTGSLNSFTPVFMLATASISGSVANLSFENQTAIIGVKKMQTAVGETVSGLTINGVVTTGTIGVVGEKLALTPSTSTSSVHAAIDLTMDAQGCTDTPVYFAALPGDETEISLVAEGSLKSYFASVGAKSVVAGKYYYTSKILGDFPVYVDATGYATIDEAFEAANESALNCVITLNADLAAADTLVVNNSAAAVTLDLHNHALQGGISVNSEFTLTDGSIEGLGTITNTDYYAVRVNEYGKFNMTGGHIVSNSAAANSLGSAVVLYGVADSANNPTASISGGVIDAPATYAIYSKYGTIDVPAASTLEVNTGNGMYIWSAAQMTIGGGTFNVSGARFIYFGAASASLTITDGTISIPDGNFANVYYNGTCSIQGGKFLWKSDGKFIYSGQSAVLTKSTVSGGYFSNEVTEYLANQRVCVADATYTGYPYAVVESLEVFDINGDKYATAADALAAVNASSSATIVKLLQDVTLDIPFAIENAVATITIDLNGHKITVPSIENCISVATGSTLTVTDSATGGEIECTTSGDNSTDLKGVAVKGNGTINIDGGTIKVKKNSYYPAGVWAYGGGTLNISGGTIIGGRCIFVEGAGTTASITGGTLTCDYTGTITGIGSMAIRVADGASIDIDEATVSAAYSGSTDGVHPIPLYITGEGTTGTVDGGSFTGDYYSVLTNTNGALTINDGDFAGTYTIYAQGASDVVVNGGKVDGAQVALYVTGSTATVNGGTLTGDASYAVRSLGGATCNLNGGLFVSKQSQTVSPTGTTASYINIHGGTFVTETDGKYPVYVATSGTAHTIFIDNAVSEPYFFGGNTDTDRAIWKGYTVNVVQVKAGYFDKQWLGKGADTYLVSGYSKVALDPVVEVDGRQYKYQVVPKP